MKRVVLGLISSLFVMAAGAAHASTIGPAPSNWTASGSITLTPDFSYASAIPVTCQVQLTGQVDAAGASDFQNGSITGCLLVSPGFGWHIVPTGPNSVTISGMKIYFPVRGGGVTLCTINVPATLSGGTLTFPTTVGNKCSVSSTGIQTTPNLTVVP